MSEAVEISSIRQQELLREAVSRQSPLSLDCRLEGGWAMLKSFFLGFDRSSGDLVVAYPSGPAHISSELVEGQTIGVSFRRAHRKCVFETSVVGRCSYAVGRADDLSALRLLWPAGILELQRRLYYRTPVPPGTRLPVQVRRWKVDSEWEEDTRTLHGRMLNISAGGLSLLLKDEDNPRWQSDTPVNCSLVASPGEGPVEIYSHLRHLDQCPDGGVRMGVQFVGLETSSEACPALEQILELTRIFQEIEMKRLGFGTP